jgi:hypothetical protein
MVLMFQVGRKKHEKVDTNGELNIGKQIAKKLDKTPGIMVLGIMIIVIVVVIAR